MLATSAEIFLTTCTMDVGMMVVGIMDIGIMHVGIIDIGILVAGIMNVGIIDVGIMNVGIIDVEVMDVGIMNVRASKRQFQTLKIRRRRKKISQPQTNAFCYKSLQAKALFM